MGWFDTVGTGDADIAVKSNDGKIYKIVQLTTIIVLIVAVAVLVFEMFGVFDINSTANGLIVSVGVLGIGGMNELPWVRIFERFTDKRFKITAIVFMAFVGLCVVLWIVCVWQIVGIVNSAAGDGFEQSFKDVLNMFETIRVVLIVSLQFMVASGVTMNIVKYRRTLIPYQVMSGVANLYIDFYLSLLLTAFTITPQGDFIKAPTAEWVNSPALGALFWISLILLIIVGIVFARTDRRRLIATANDAAVVAPVDKNAELKEKVEPESNSDSIAERLKKLQKLYDDGLITKEDYDNKRAEILSDF